MGQTRKKERQNKKKENNKEKPKRKKRKISHLAPILLQGCQDFLGDLPGRDDSKTPLGGLELPDVKTPCWNNLKKWNTPCWCVFFETHSHNISKKKLLRSPRLLLHRFCTLSLTAWVSFVHGPFFVLVLASCVCCDDSCVFCVLKILKLSFWIFSGVVFCVFHAVPMLFTWCSLWCLRGAFCGLFCNG